MHNKTADSTSQERPLAEKPAEMLASNSYGMGRPLPPGPPGAHRFVTGSVQLDIHPVAPSKEKALSVKHHVSDASPTLGPLL